MVYYDGTKLLSLKDINGEVPGIYMTTTNRSAGKTTFFNRFLVKKFITNKEKFILLYRYNYELYDVDRKFFSEIKALFFPEYEMTSKQKAKGTFAELFLNDKSCGYAIALNNSSALRKNSHLFADATRILFDEFQDENNVYVPNEINKFLSIYTSIARGGGQQSRKVPVYMLSNTVNILNPYFVNLGISERLQKDTKYLRGDGFVLEQGCNLSASNALKANPVLKAFNSTYTDYATNASYLYDDSAFIEKITGNNRYIATIKFEGQDYSLREFTEQNLIYCSDIVDSTFNYKIAVTTSDHSQGYVYKNNDNLTIMSLRDYFNAGCFRFKNSECKRAVLNYLKY